MNSATFGGKWTQEKLLILESYLDTYTTALKDQPFRLSYVDAFAGSGSWNPKSGYSEEEYEDFRDLLRGSASIALDVQDKPFDRLVFIEADTQRSESLEALRSQHQDRRIDVINSDANAVLPEFCASMASNDRAVVFLDPYATEVSWETIESIAETGKVDCWILFPLMAITRMMPRNNEPTEALATNLDRHLRRAGALGELLRLFQAVVSPRRRTASTKRGRQQPDCRPLSRTARIGLSNDGSNQKDFPQLQERANV